MTRIHTTISLLLHRLRRSERDAQRRFLMMNLADLDPLPLGPGWFDSSWELENGLEVCEDSVLDVQLQPWFETTKLKPVLEVKRSAAGDRANLIEFEPTDLGARPAPAERSDPARRQSAELELALA